MEPAQLISCAVPALCSSTSLETAFLVGPFPQASQRLVVVLAVAVTVRSKEPLLPFHVHLYEVPTVHVPTNS